MKEESFDVSCAACYGLRWGLFLQIRHLLWTQAKLCRNTSTIAGEPMEGS
jgi:hypothetical protein